MSSGDTRSSGGWSVLRDGLLLSIGTLTALRVPSPRTVDRDRAGVAMIFAPLAVLPIGALAALVIWAGYHRLSLDTSVVAVATVIAIALGSRALHLDGLSDVADALTSGHDQERSLAVMKDSAAGPAGVAAIALTLVLQATAINAILVQEHAWLIVGTLVCVSRATLLVGCASVVPPARDSGLAVDYARTIPLIVTVLLWLAMTIVCIAVMIVTGLPAWRGILTAVLGLLAAIVVVHRSVRRFGGVTGDVFGATIEIALAVMLVSLATYPDVFVG